VDSYNYLLEISRVNMGWICFGIIVMGLCIDNGLGNISRAILLTQLAKANMTPEEAIEYISRFSKSMKEDK
jgi:hypothetical protein